MELTKLSEWLDEENTEKILNEGKFDFVVDAIDTLSPKVFLIKSCVEKRIPIISSMGSGAKMDPSKVTIADIAKTTYCPLAKAVRQRLSKLGIKQGVTVVYSTESADKSSVILTEGEQYKKSTTGTISYMPALFGLYLASHVIRELIKTD